MPRGLAEAGADRLLRFLGSASVSRVFALSLRAEASPAPPPSPPSPRTAAIPPRRVPPRLVSRCPRRPPRDGRAPGSKWPRPPPLFFALSARTSSLLSSSCSHWPSSSCRSFRRCFTRFCQRWPCVMGSSLSSHDGVTRAVYKFAAYRQNRAQVLAGRGHGAERRSTQPTRRRKRGDPHAQAVEAVRARSRRTARSGSASEDPGRAAAVRAACDAILALHPPTVTLNLTGAEVCSAALTRWRTSS